MKRLNIVLVLVLCSIIRLWKINSLPVLGLPLWLNLRYLSAILGIANILLIYVCLNKAFKRQSLSVMAAFIYGVFPWTITQSRVAVSDNLAVFSLLSLVLIWLFTNKRAYFIPLLIILFAVWGFTYPQFWLYRAGFFSLNYQHFLDNFFALVSIEMQYFHNSTFWWGGVREVGMLNLPTLPFLLYGTYVSIINDKYKTLFIMFILITAIAALSPFFPESREYYLALPFSAFFISVGIIKARNMVKKPVFYIFLLLFIFIFSFDIAQFLHFYIRHFPQRLEKEITNIHEPY